MKIGINAMQVRAAKSGVGQYIHGFSEAAVRLYPDDDFLIYCNAANEPNYRYDLPNSRTKIWGKGSLPRAVRLSYEAAFLPAELRRDKLDVFHGASNFLPGLRTDCPYVVTIHDLSYHVHPERCPFVRRQYWYAMTSRTVTLADRIITISENSRNDIMQFFPGSEDRIRIIPQAAHARFRPVEYTRAESSLRRFEDRLNGRPYVLYIGTLEPGKNVQRIVEAFDRIAVKFPDHQLVLAGDKGWLFEPIFEAIARAGARERIHYLGHVSDDEAVDLFNFAETFVFPSLYEGFGMPPLEAMACGCPVITSTSSSLPEVVGDAAIQVDATSADQLADALDDLLSSEDRRRALSLAGKERAAGFSWAKTAAATLDVYRELL